MKDSFKLLFGTLAAILFFVNGPAALAGESAELPAAEILARYVRMPMGEGYYLNKEREARLKTLRELEALKGMPPEPIVREIIRTMAEVKEPRQLVELADALRFFPTRESAARLCTLLDHPDKDVRNEAITILRLMARRVDRSGGQRTQRGGEFPPQVEGLVPHLIKAAGDSYDMNRVAALFALADTLDPAAVDEIRRRLKDDSEKVRFHAACFLTEFHDASGLGELKTALARMRAPKDPQPSFSFDEEKLLASFERITGKSFGKIPSNPELSSDSRVASESKKTYKELLDKWAAWWAWEPAKDQ